jgi:hypothetical protein
MSRSLDQPILVSASFAAACGEQRERLVSIGRYALRGVGRPQELFTLDLAERAPPRRPRKARLARAACATLRLSARETLGLQKSFVPRASWHLCDSDKKHGVLRLRLGDHGAADGHGQGDDAVDALGALSLAGLRLPAGSWATARSETVS